MKNFEQWLEATHPECLEEGWRDWAKKGVVAATMGAAGLGMMPGQSHSVSSTRPGAEARDIQPGDPTIRAKFKNGKMSPFEWWRYAKYYGEPDETGFVPDPKVPNRWIPGDGADVVRVQSRTQIDNDDVTSDDVGFTPYKGGKSMGQTNWQDMK